jgi:hypothetical protein
MPLSFIDLKSRKKNWKIKSGNSLAKTSESGIKASNKISPTIMNGLTHSKNSGKMPKSQSINKNTSSFSSMTPSKSNSNANPKSDNSKNKEPSKTPLK